MRVCTRARFEMGEMVLTLALTRKLPQALCRPATSARSAAGCPPDGLEEQFPIRRELVWLHRECRRFYTPSAYRRHNKPAFGPVGDSLDDLQ
jgi:hypothetical protein